jgi:hypothetical protein
LAVVTAFLGAGQVQLFTQQIEQRGPGINLDVAVLTVQLECDGTGGNPTCGGRRFAHGSLTVWGLWLPVLRRIAEDFRHSMRFPCA